MHQYLYDCSEIFICLTPSHCLEVTECMSYDTSDRILNGAYVDFCFFGCFYTWYICLSQNSLSTLLALSVCFPTVIVNLNCGMFAEILLPSTLEPPKAVYPVYPGNQVWNLKVAEQCFIFLFGVTTKLAQCN